MSNLNELLQTLSEKEQIRHINKLFERITEQVNSILSFGPSNKNIAEKTANVYFYRRKNKFFLANYTVQEIKTLPAVISSALKFYEPKYIASSALDEQRNLLKQAFLYATGTCESFAIVGAYYLSLIYDVELTIETIYSRESHTYIRLHTKPEFFLDFWTPSCGLYNNSFQWNTSVDNSYMRTKKSRFHSDISLNSLQIQELVVEFFNPENILQREIHLAKVHELVSQELASSQKIQESKLNFLVEADGEMQVGSTLG
jgi:hypothetical protein